MPAFSLTDYIKLRLGATAREQTANFLKLPFGATSFARFWWYWNPVYGYYLYYYIYKPFAIYLTRPIAVLATFIFCGVLHDLPFILLSVFALKRIPSFTITTMFLFLGMVVVLTEKLNINFRRVPVTGRWLIHLLNIFLCWEMALYLTTRA